MLGSHNFGFELEPGIKEATARKRLSEVSDEYGLDIQDVDLEFDSSLPYNVMGRTSVSGYSSNNPKITVGDSFLEASEPEQLKTMLHEGIHVKQFEGELGDWLKSEHDVSEDFAREAERYSNARNLEDIEGITEVITDTLLPFDVGTGYPYEKRSKMSELEAKGFDVESELADNIENEINEAIDGYKEVYQQFEIGDVYLEKGSFEGKDYLAVTIGYGDGESAINDCLIEEGISQDYSEFLEPDISSDYGAV